jgi:hypothetical protein
MVHWTFFIINNNSKVGWNMDKIIYRGKTYIKIKQDWYSDLGAKQPLKIAVALDAIFHEQMLKESASLIDMIDQGRHYATIGQPKKAYDMFLSATQLALEQLDINQLMVAVPRLVQVAISIGAQHEIVSLLKQHENKEQIIDQPHYRTALATLFLSLDQPQEAFDYVLEATLLFRVQKKKMSDEAMMVWSTLKKQFPEIYKQVGDKLKADKTES